MWKEKVQTVPDGKDNLCPESETGVLLAGLCGRARRGGSASL